MSSRRVLKAAEAIREVVSMAILVELRDPRIQDVTVTFVEVSADMRLAKVHVSVMGDEAKQQLSLHGLQNSAGYLQQKVSQRIDTRYTPKIRFVLDQGIKNSMQVARILEEVLPADEPAGQVPHAEAGEVAMSDDHSDSDDLKSDDSNVNQEAASDLSATDDDQDQSSGS